MRDTLIPYVYLLVGMCWVRTVCISKVRTRTDDLRCVLP
jgi:hypothetical protein